MSLVPTATQLEADVHETAPKPSRSPDCAGLFSTVQLLPFHLAKYGLSKGEPTARHEEAPGHDTPPTKASLGSGGAGGTDQWVPSQRSNGDPPYSPVAVQADAELQETAVSCCSNP